MTSSPTASAIAIEAIVPSGNWPGPEGALKVVAAVIVTVQSVNPDAAVPRTTQVVGVKLTSVQLALFWKMRGHQSAVAGSSTSNATARSKVIDAIRPAPFRAPNSGAVVFPLRG